MPLRLRRGTNAERLTITPLEGELIYTTDNKQVFVGDGNTVGGISLISSTGGFLGNDLSLNGNDITGIGNISFTGVLSNGTLSFENSVITSNNSFIATGSGNNISIVNIGNNISPVQTIRSFSESVEPLEIQYGTTNGFFSLVTNKNSSRGTVESPTVIQAGDCLSYDRVFGYDGFDYVLSSAIWHGIDPGSTPTTGFSPGAIALITEGLTGQNILSFDSRGYLGINKFPTAAAEALDVNGNGLFSGSVTSSAFIGSVYSEDSTLMVDTNSMVLSNGTISIENNNILSTENYVSSFTGNLINLIDIGDKITSTQLRNYFNEPLDAFQTTYGISQGFTGLANNFYSSKGTFDLPTSLELGDTIHTLNMFGHDGSEYRFTCGIRFGVDVDNVPSTGIVPGNIIFLTTAPDGSISTSSMSSEGFFAINSNGVPATSSLDVYGDATIRGSTVTQSLKGLITFNSPFTGNSIEIIDIGSFDAPTQLRHYFKEQVDPYHQIYGIAGSFTGLGLNYYSSRGDFGAETALSPGDTINTINSFGHDGSGYGFSSGIRFGVDFFGTVSPGIVPGEINFFTIRSDGNIQQSVINSNGYLGINSGGAPLTAHLDVFGDGNIRGTLKLDKLLGFNTFNSPFTGNTISQLEIGDDATPVQIRQYHKELDNSFYKVYGIAGGFTGLSSDFSVSRGTLSSPTSVVQADTIHTINAFAHDGSNYLFAAGIRFGVDVFNPVSTGIVPGEVLILTTKTDGSIAQSTFSGQGYLGINTGGSPVEQALDVHGNAIIRGNISAISFNGSIISNDSLVVFDDETGNINGNQITAAAFKGTFVGDDSTIIIDGINGNVSGNVITGNVVTGGSVELSSNTISTTDSSDLTIVQATTFLSDIYVEGRVTANEFVTTSVGSPVISSPTTLTLSAGAVVEVTGAPFRLPKFTTTERDALIAVNGDMIYNTDLNKFQGYENGVWVNLI